jgi:hypothetical protein
VWEKKAEERQRDAVKYARRAAHHASEALRMREQQERKQQQLQGAEP